MGVVILCGFVGTALLATAIGAEAQALDKGNAKGALDGIGTKLKADEIRQWMLTPVEMAAKAQAARKPAMKAFANLPKEDLDALVAFLAKKK